jgi:hypothetical protein
MRLPKVLSIGIGGVILITLAWQLASGPLGRQPAGELLTDTLERYCIDCHNGIDLTADLALDRAELADIGAHAEVWEQVVHKLAAGTMPPADEPRPGSETLIAIEDYLERALDAAAAASPNPGRLPQLHRLTRTEYRNAIRDLLALEHLPAEMDYELLLPADNASSGFDNIADLLFVSPVVMERYLSAATRISRLAVGDPDMPTLVNIHRLPLELPQDERVDGLPPGTRGGLATETFFPLDGDYAFDIELAGLSREPHEIEITIDGEPVARETIGRGALEIRAPVAAGAHQVGVTLGEPGARRRARARRAARCCDHRCWAA